MEGGVEKRPSAGQGPPPHGTAGASAAPDFSRRAVHHASHRIEPIGRHDAVRGELPQRLLRLRRKASRPRRDVLEKGRAALPEEVEDVARRPHDLAVALLPGLEQPRKGVSEPHRYRHQAGQHRTVYRRGSVRRAAAEAAPCNLARVAQLVKRRRAVLRDARAENVRFPGAGRGLENPASVRSRPGARPRPWSGCRRSSAATRRGIG